MTTSSTPLVRVVDHVPFEAAVNPRQALAYCRRVLVGWEEHPSGVVAVFVRREGAVIGLATEVPLRADFADYPKRMAELCDDLVRLGFASQPSDVLRAMAAEVVT